MPPRHPPNRRGAESHRGDELFYRGLNDDFIAAQVRLAPGFSLIGQRRLFSAAGYTPGLDHATFDVSRDDRRFLMLRVGTTGGMEDAAAHLILVQNFFGDLRRVPR